MSLLEGYPNHPVWSTWLDLSSFPQLFPLGEYANLCRLVLRISQMPCATNSPCQGPGFFSPLRVLL